MAKLPPARATESKPISVWAQRLELGSDSLGAGAPAYLRVSRALAELIRAGRLRAGARLPGTRTLAQELGLHRNTVIKAYAELHSEGWIETAHAKGTYVSAAIPVERLPVSKSGETLRLPFELPKGWAFDAPAEEPTGNRLRLFGGSPDLRLLPTTVIARAYRRVLRDAPRLLNYSSPRGHQSLRRELAKFLATTRALDVDEDEILITRGSQMALYLAAAAILERGDSVVVEAMGYPPAWQALRASGARLSACRIDEQGLDTDHLERICERQKRRGAPVRAVYLTPHHQYPTTVTLAPGRRMSLNALAERFGFFVFEDDYDHEFHYEGQPLLPLAASYPRGHLIYLGTLSKILAPGLRIGFLVAPKAVLARATGLRYFIDRQGDTAAEAVVAELMEEGELQRHVRKTRWVYQERRDECVRALRETFAERLSFFVPSGGMALWIRTCRPLVGRWLDESRRLGVEFQSGQGFARKPLPDEYVRAGFAALTTKEMARAVERLHTAWSRAERALG